MAWTTLTEDRLKNTPWLLAGPILRKVTADEVTVWVVLKLSAKVSLKILNSAGNPHWPLEAERDTIAVGTHFHIVAVTKKRASIETKLVEGEIYQYDLTFKPANEGPRKLAAVTA